MEKFQIASVRWPADLKAELEALAKADDRNFSSLVIHVLRQYVAERNRKSRKA